MSRREQDRIPPSDGDLGKEAVYDGSVVRNAGIAVEKFRTGYLDDRLLRWYTYARVVDCAQCL